ncbi:MAG: TylF/MycF/NovP-related O-methyltransferase, partial [Aristaeellaceae bacterium]
MKKVVVVGCSSLIISAAEQLNPLEMKVVGLGDTRSEAWNVFDESGNIKDEFDEMPVMPVDLSVGFDPDVIVIAAADEATASSLRYTVIKAGYLGDILFFNELMSQFSVRSAALRRTAERISTLGVPGSVAEMGCYRGDTSWQLSALLPDRTLYLFDTFSGLDPRDLEEEKKLFPDTRA